MNSAAIEFVGTTTEIVSGLWGELRRLERPGALPATSSIDAKLASLERAIVGAESAFRAFYAAPTLEGITAYATAQRRAEEFVAELDMKAADKHCTVAQARRLRRHRRA